MSASPDASAPAQAAAQAAARGIKLALLLITLVALVLRLPGLGGTWPSADEGMLAVYAIDSMPEGGLLESLTRIERSAVGNPLRLLAHPLSVTTAVLVFAAAAFARLTGIAFSEHLSLLPTAVLGALTPLLAYRLVSTLSGRRAGLAAAALLAVTPLHALLSRSIAAGFIPAVALETLALLLLLRLAGSGGLRLPRTELALGLTLAAYLLSHNQFPALAPVLLYAAIAGSAAENARARIAAALGAFLRPRVWMPPALVLSGLLVTYVAFTHYYVPQYRFTGPRGVGILGHMLGRGVDHGWYGRFVLGEAVAGFGWPFLVAIGLGLAAWIAGAGRNARSAILAAWSLSYLWPFLFVVMPGKTLIRGYLGDGIYPLVLLAGVALAHGLERPGLARLAAGTVLGLALALGLVTSLAGIHRWPLGRALELPSFHGMRKPDTGLKAAGLWARQQTPASARFFVAGFDPPLARYYLKRRVTGALKMREGFRACLDAAEVDYLLATPRAAEALALESPSDWWPVLAIEDGGELRAQVYRREADGPPPGRLEVEAANLSFDRDHARVRELMGMPDGNLCAGAPGALAR